MSVCADEGRGMSACGGSVCVGMGVCVCMEMDECVRGWMSVCGGEGSVGKG